MSQSAASGPGPAITGAEAGVIADVVRLLRSDRDWTARMPEVLALVGTRLGLSRVFLFEIHEIDGGGLGQTCRFDWAAPGLAGLADDPRNIAEPFEVDPLFEEWTARRRRGETIAGLTRDLTGYLREDFEHQRIKSYLSVPIIVNGTWWGHIGFDDCETERAWAPGERSVLESIAYLVASAVELSGSSLVMSEASREAMLSAAIDGVVVVDEACRILEFNPAAEAMFGYGRAEALGHRLDEMIVLADGEGGVEKLGGCGPEDILGRRTEALGRRADGATIPIELTVTGIRVAQRRLFVAYLRDLTERKAAEEEAARQRAALHQSEKMSALGSLLAGIAHELNNPLSVVVGRAVMLEETCEDPAQLDQLRRLREAAERCSRISQNFLKMARKSPTHRLPTRLDDVVRGALDMVGYTARANGVEIVLDFAPDMPETLADADQITQVAVNLMINAVQAMAGRQGRRCLTVTTRYEAEGGSVVLEVRDTGPGIPADIMARIFEPFFTTKQVGVGTGVGLAVSQGMVVSHNGVLTAENHPDGGALFRMSLPLERPVADTAAKTARFADAGPARGRSVLVVDDEPEVALLIQEILERAGATVEIAENGVVGLDRVASRRFDAVFCDLRMPQLDGRGFRAALAQRDPALASRVVFVTGDHYGLEPHGGSIDGCRVLEKPFSAGDILANLSALVAH